ncbi:phosphotransferase [Actinomyces trachealis]|uniref:phosphotransferase n=1 Tax=Actinomyces trachealis TaxID=2763540 RepID=UPI0018C48C42|nr:phosphotransferase [Actinomyces trachealis]
MSTEKNRSTPAVQHPEPGTGTCDALSRLPGIRRAWPARDGSISIECRDEQGRLRAGTLAPQGTVSMLPYATDPALPALAPPPHGELVVHRAARRAVVLEPERVRKATRSGRAAPSSAALAAFGAFTAMGLRVPRVLAVGDAYIDLERLPGCSLAELGDDGLEGWKQLAGVWGGLSRPDADLPVHGPRQEAEVLRGWFGNASRRGLLTGLVEDPEALEHAVEEVCAKLVQDTPGSMTLSHRDLHDGQLLWNGEVLSLIDLDTACLAEAELDLGNLIAHAELMNVQGRLSDRGAERLSPVLDLMCSAVPAHADRLSIYRRSAALRLIFVHAFRPGARAWLPTWVCRSLAPLPSSCTINLSLRSAPCV